MYQDLLVVNFAGDNAVRVWKDSAEARKALSDWREHDEKYLKGEVSDDDYQSLDEWMEARGIQSFTTNSYWFGF